MLAWFWMNWVRTRTKIILHLTKLAILELYHSARVLRTGKYLYRARERERKKEMSHSEPGSVNAMHGWRISNQEVSGQILCTEPLSRSGTGGSSPDFHSLLSLIWGRMKWNAPCPCQIQRPEVDFDVYSGWGSGTKLKANKRNIIIKKKVHRTHKHDVNPDKSCKGVNWYYC